MTAYLRRLPPLSVDFLLRFLEDLCLSLVLNEQHESQELQLLSRSLASEYVSVSLLEPLLLDQLELGLRRLYLLFLGRPLQQFKRLNLKPNAKYFSYHWKLTALHKGLNLETGCFSVKAGSEHAWRKIPVLTRGKTQEPAMRLNSEISAEKAGIVPTAKTKTTSDTDSIAHLPLLCYQV